MHLRKLTFTVGLIGAMCSTWAYGLGLGEINLKSTLNQPLDAEIKLLQVRSLTEEDIHVALAKPEDFQRFGVDRAFFLVNLDFDVQLDHPDGPMVRVTTDEPVREPYLIFLLEAQSPAGGRLLREYTLLMDLPVFADEGVQPVQGVQAGPANQQQAQAPSRAQPAPQGQPIRPVQPAQRREEPPRAQPAPQRRVSPQPAEPGADVYGPVQANDTLWEIAERVRPNGSVSVQQTMLALQRANPDAFINGNINMLKRGQVLRVPSEGEMLSLDQRSAISEVAYQNNQWSAARDGQIAGAELDAASSRPAVQPREEGRRGQLTLAAPGQADSAGERSGAGDSSARNEALENELAITSEELDAARRENQELSTRVAELEEQIATMERLIEVSSEELRAMQLAAERNQSEEQAESAAEAGTPTEGEATSSETEPTEAAVTEAAEPNEAGSGAEPARDPAAAGETPTEEKAEPAPQPVAQPPRTVVPSIPPQPTLMDMLMANLWYVLIAALALIGGLVYFLHRRNQAAELAAFENDEFYDEFDDLPPEETLDESAGFEEELNFGSEDPLNAEDEYEEADEPVEAETGDAVGEADIYIAYGKFEQAEEMLQRAIVNEPNNIDARLKLLEVYSETRNVEKFDREYGHLISLGDGAASARAGELRAAIPNAEPYAGDMPALAAAAQSNEVASPTPAEESFEFDEGELDIGELTLEADSEESESTFSLNNDSHGSGDDGLGELSFDLDGDEGEVTLDGDGSEAELPGANSSDDETGFDFELDFSAEGEESTAAGSGETETDEFDLGDEFSFSATEGDEELNLSLESGDSEAEPGPSSAQNDGLDFSLELDGLSSDDEEDNSDILSLGDDAGGLNLELDDGDDDLPNLDLEDSLSLDDDADGEEDTDEDILAGLDFSTEGLSVEEDQDAAAPNLGEFSPASGEDADDDFDMDMGDLDLKALDQEMDALVGGVDDDDDDLALAAPPKAALGSASQTETEFDLDSLTGGASNGAKEELFSFDSSEFGEDQDAGAEEDLDGELDFLSDTDEVSTKLDLARAYIDMGDQEGAKDILDEVSSEGSEEQKREAAELLEKIV